MSEEKWRVSRWREYRPVPSNYQLPFFEAQGNQLPIAPSNIRQGRSRWAIQQSFGGKHWVLWGEVMSVRHKRDLRGH